PADSSAGLWQPIAASPVHISPRVANVHETPLVFFQHKARQAAGCIAGRVDSDPIEANLWDYRRRVAVHDKLSGLSLAGQKHISDGQEIIAILAIEWHARPHSGMAEKVITDSCRILETF